jgi:hypothetical protein
VIQESEQSFYDGGLVRLLIRRGQAAAHERLVSSESARRNNAARVGEEKLGNIIR